MRRNEHTSNTIVQCSDGKLGNAIEFSMCKVTVIEQNTIESRQANIQASLDKSVRGLLSFQQFETTEITKLNNGEGLVVHNSSVLCARQCSKSVFEDPVAELKNIEKSSTVEVYQDLFEALMNIGESSESYAISLCIGGLKDEIGMPCDQKYKCSGQIYSLKVIASDEICDEDEDCVVTDQGVISATRNEEELMPQISLNALV
ncbi:hypothetical protein Tco_0608744 [Tanacetum coccineum]